jgi:FMN phosphatase YigB (HAD superfamily)
MMDQVKALLFDVFGTVVDWRSSVISELQALGEKSGIAPGKNYQERENFLSLSFKFLKLMIIHIIIRNHGLGKVRT